MAKPAREERPLRLRETLAYAGVNLPIAVLHQPTLSIVPALYAKVAHIDLVAVGAVLLVARVLDAALDPIIGYISDQTRGRWGRRKPWIVAGAVTCSIAAYFLFRPGRSTDLFYFTTWYLVLYVGWTLVEIPHTAWARDLTSAEPQRVRLFSYRALMGFGGALLFYATPFLPIWADTRIDAAVLAMVSWGVILSALPLALLAGFIVRTEEASSAPSLHMRTVALDLARDRLLRRYLLIAAAPELASGMVAGLYVFYIDSYLHIGDKIAHVALAVTVVSAASTPLWSRLIPRLGEPRTIALNGLWTAATLVAMLLNSPGPLAFPILMGAFLSSALMAAGLEPALLALLAWVADGGGDADIKPDLPRSAADQAGSYFAAKALTSKVALAAGGGLGLLLAGLFGFKASGGNGPLATTGFFLAFCGVPIVLNLATVALALRFPRPPPRASTPRVG